MVIPTIALILLVIIATILSGYKEEKYYLHIYPISDKGDSPVVYLSEVSYNGKNYYVYKHSKHIYTPRDFIGFKYGLTEISCSTIEKKVSVPTLETTTYTLDRTGIKFFSFRPEIKNKYVFYI